MGDNSEKFITSSTEDDYTKHLTNTKWIVWYHNPSDKNWGLDSYKDIIEISSIEDFWVLKNSWDSCLPKIYEGMFFLMRKNKTGCIYPQWEDKHNRKGGYWSFKVSKDKAEEAWFNLMMFTLGECVVGDVNEIKYINGISISPKKNFCIIKIWNSDSTKCSNDLLSKKITFLNIEEVIYSNHEDNIKKDADKFKRREQYKKKNGYGGGYNNRNGGYNRNGGRRGGYRNKY